MILQFSFLDEYIRGSGGAEAELTFSTPWRNNLLSRFVCLNRTDQLVYEYAGRMVDGFTKWASKRSVIFLNLHSWTKIYDFDEIYENHAIRLEALH